MVVGDQRLISVSEDGQLIEVGMLDRSTGSSGVGCPA